MFYLLILIFLFDIGVIRSVMLGEVVKAKLNLVLSPELALLHELQVMLLSPFLTLMGW